MVSSTKLNRLQKQRERLLLRRRKQEEQLCKLRQEARREERMLGQQIIDEKYAVLVNFLKKANFPMDDDNFAFFIGLALEAVDIIHGTDQERKTALLNKYQERYLQYLASQEPSTDAIPAADTSPTVPEYDDAEGM